MRKEPTTQEPTSVGKRPNASKKLVCVYMYTYIRRRANEEKANERRANKCMEGEKLICIYKYI